MLSVNERHAINPSEVADAFQRIGVARRAAADGTSIFIHAAVALDIFFISSIPPARFKTFGQSIRCGHLVKTPGSCVQFRHVETRAER
jgi:hypothetical protein